MNQSIADLARELWKSGDRESAILALEQEGAKGDYEAYDLLTLLSMPLVQSKSDYDQVVGYIRKGAALGSLECQVALYIIDHLDENRLLEVNDETADYLIQALDKGSQAALSCLYYDTKLDPEIWIPYTKRLFETLENTKATFPVSVDEAICGVVVTAYIYNRDRPFVRRVLDYLTPMANRGCVDAIVAFMNIYIFYNFNYLEDAQLEAWADMIVETEPGFCYFFHGMLRIKQDDYAGAALNWKQASDHDFEEATVYYAHLLMRGAGVPQDMDTAARLLEPLEDADIHAARGLAYIAMFKDEQNGNLSEAIRILEKHQDKLPYTTRRDILVYVMYAIHKGVKSDHPYLNQLSELFARYKEEGFDFTCLRWFAVWNEWIKEPYTPKDMVFGLIDQIKQYTLDLTGSLLLGHLVGYDDPKFSWKSLGAVALQLFLDPKLRHAAALGAFKYAEDDKNVEMQESFLEFTEIFANIIGDYNLQMDTHYYKYCHQLFDLDHHVKPYDPIISEYLNFANTTYFSDPYYYMNARLALTPDPEWEDQLDSTDVSWNIRQPMYSFHWYTTVRMRELLAHMPEDLLAECDMAWYVEEYTKNAQLCVPYLDPDIVLKGIAASVDLL